MTKVNHYFLAPETPPSKITCKIEDHSIRVEWQPPTKSNGEIRTYHVMWFDVENKRRIEEKQITTFTIDDFKRDSKFKVRVSAFNSAGKSPSGYCEIDTSQIPVGRSPMIFSVNAPIAIQDIEVDDGVSNLSPRALAN